MAEPISSRDFSNRPRRKPPSRSDLGVSDLDQPVSEQPDTEEPGDYEKSLLAQWPAESLLEANVAALRERDAGAAEAIMGVEVPDTVHIAVCQDGSVSFRLDQADGSRRWLGASSVPLVAARANLERTQIGSGTMAMYGIGSGAEAEAILKEMSPYQALVVIEPDRLNLNLVFRLRDFTWYLGRGQLVLLIGDDPEGLLEDFFTRHPGYNAVSEAVRWTWRTEQQNQLFHQQVGLAMDRVISKNNAALQGFIQRQQGFEEENPLSDAIKHFQADRLSTLRVANCSNAYTLTDLSTTRDLLRGFERLGAQCDRQVLDRPDIVSHYAQLSRLERIQPHLIVLVDALRGDFAARLPVNVVCATVLREPPSSMVEADQRPADRMAKHDVVFYPFTDQRESLLGAGLSENRLFHLPPGVNDELFHPLGSEDRVGEDSQGEVVFVSDRPSIEPESYNITLHTHQILWQAVGEEIAKAAGDYHPDAALKYLRRGQRCGVELREEELRDYFLELIRNFLGEAIRRDVYMEAVAQAGYDLRIRPWAPLRRQGEGKSHFWDESPVAEQVGEPIDHGEGLNRLYNSAKIFVHLSGTGYPDSYLLNGIAAGAFFLVKSHPRDRRRDGIGQFFEINREIITFDGPKDLIRKISFYLENEPERRQIAQAAREKLLSEHTTRQRAGSIAAAIAAMGA